MILLKWSVIKIEVSGQHQKKKMKEFNEIEFQCFNLIENKISVKELENWVYHSKWLEEELEKE